MPSYVDAKKNTAYVTYVELIDQASGKVFKVNPTLAAGDVRVSIDGGTFANLTTLPTVTPSGGKQVKVSLSAAEMNGDVIGVEFSDVAGAEWNDLYIKIPTVANQIDEIAARLPAALVSGRMDSSVGAYQSGLTPLQPTVAGRTLDVSATGEAGLDWANIGAPTTTVGLTGTTISTSQVVASVSGAVGSVTGNVGGNVTGSVGSVATGGIVAASFASGAINAAAIAADAIGASELAADAIAEIADGVWDEVLSGHLTSGTTGAALNSAGSSGDPWGTALPGAYGAGTAGNIVGNRLDVAVSTRLAPTVAGRTLDVATTGEAGLDFDNIKDATGAHTLTNITVPTVTSVTNDVGITQAGADKVWSSATRTLTAFGFSVTLTAPGVQAIWDALSANLTTVGSIGKRLVDFITGDAFVRLGAPAGASHAADVAAVKSDTGAIKTKTDSLTFTVAGMVDSNVVDWKGAPAPAMTGDAFARLGAPAGASVSADIAAIKTDTGAIKAKTDTLPAAPAAVGDIPTALQNADALLNRDMSAVSDTNARSPLNALRRLRNKNDAAVTPGSIVIYKENDSTTAYVATLTTDAAAVPVTVFDPTT